MLWPQVVSLGFLLVCIHVLCCVSLVPLPLWSGRQVDRALLVSSSSSRLEGQDSEEGKLLSHIQGGQKAVCSCECAKHKIFTFLKYIFKKILFNFKERGREGEREGEKHQCVLASHAPPTEDPDCNPGMYPVWESNWRPFGSQAGAQPTEPPQPGHQVYPCTAIC